VSFVDKVAHLVSSLISTMIVKVVNFGGEILCLNEGIIIVFSLDFLNSLLFIASELFAQIGTSEGGLSTAHDAHGSKYSDLFKHF
jgi:hypothetical protein